MGKGDLNATLGPRFRALSRYDIVHVRLVESTPWSACFTPSRIFARSDGGGGAVKRPLRRGVRGADPISPTAVSPARQRRDPHQQRTHPAWWSCRRSTWP